MEAKMSLEAENKIFLLSFGISELYSSARGT